MKRSLPMRAVLLAAVLLAFSGCAIAPNGVDDPTGAGAAIQRCLDKKKEDRTLPDWFAIFGPALACR
jgi:type IV pilus biogenesis protein CpaD/CtpE